MARLIRYQPKRAGIRGVARSREVDAHLADRAQAVADLAQALYDSDPPHSGRVDVEVVNDSDSDRARVAVIARHPAALPIEAERRVLGGSLDAAR
jgi:hypothetical protein